MICRYAWPGPAAPPRRLPVTIDTVVAAEFFPVLRIRNLVAGPDAVLTRIVARRVTLRGMQVRRRYVRFAAGLRDDLGDALVAAAGFLPASLAIRSARAWTSSIVSSVNTLA